MTTKKSKKAPSTKTKKHYFYINEDLENSKSDHDSSNDETESDIDNEE